MLRSFQVGCSVAPYSLLNDQHKHFCRIAAIPVTLKITFPTLYIRLTTFLNDMPQEPALPPWIFKAT